MLAATSCVSSSAQALACPQFCTLDYYSPDYGYVAVEGGPTWLRDMHIRVNESVGNGLVFAFHTDYKIGYGVGLILGTAMQCWRFEIEGYYRKNQGKTFLIANFGQVNPAPFYYRMFGIMGNAYYDFYLWCNYLKLYLGVGVGPTWVRFQTTPVIGGTLLKFDIDSVRFSYQGMAGLSYCLPCGFTLSAGYRAWAALRRSGVPGNIGSLSVKVSEEHEPIVQSVEAKLSFAF